MEENDGQQVVAITTPLLSGRTYEWLKFAATVLFPGVTALYLALGNLWNFPHVEEVAGTLMAINTFIGLIVKVSSDQYQREDKNFDGVIVIDDSGPKTQVLTQYVKDPRDLTKQGVFKVVHK